jgi:hypothetical protein
MMDGVDISFGEAPIIVSCIGSSRYRSRRSSYKFPALCTTCSRAPGTMGIFSVFRVLRLAGQIAGHGVSWSLPNFFVSFPLGFLVPGVLSAAMLPTSYGKGMLVSLIYRFLIFLFTAVILIVLVFGLPIARFG